MRFTIVHSNETGGSDVEKKNLHETVVRSTREKCICFASFSSVANRLRNSEQLKSTVWVPRVARNRPRIEGNALVASNAIAYNRQP